MSKPNNKRFVGTLILLTGLLFLEAAIIGGQVFYFVVAFCMFGLAAVNFLQA